MMKGGTAMYSALLLRMETMRPLTRRSTMMSNKDGEREWYVVFEGKHKHCTRLGFLE